MDMRKQIPEGVRDSMPQECARKRAVEETIRRRFSLCGYEEVSPPVLEYAALYDSRPQQAMIKTFDPQGHTLALRPEFTTSIARIVSTRMREALRPLRLCYLGVAFDHQYDQRSFTTREFTQAGVELIGSDAPQADAEIIQLAASVLSEAGLDDFLIDIGQVEFFKGLLEEIGLSDVQAEALRKSVEEKNVLDMELQLKHLGLSDEVFTRLMAVPMLYGGEEVLAEAERMTGNPRSLKALENLRTVYGLLCACGLEKRLTIDLGLVHSIEYYTGVVFRGISGHLGAPILSGGRYDHLGDRFQSPSPATGFALGVERMMDAMERERPSAVGERRMDIIAAVEGDVFTAEDFATIERWRTQGSRVELFYGKSDEDLRARAENSGARAVRLMGGTAKWI